MLSKGHLISAIQQINVSVSPEWLASFDTSALKRYLDHLQMTLEPRGRTSRWQRPNDSPVIVTRQPVA